MLPCLSLYIFIVFDHEPNITPNSLYVYRMYAYLPSLAVCVSYLI